MSCQTHRAEYQMTSALRHHCDLILPKSALARLIVCLLMLMLASTAWPASLSAVGTPTIAQPETPKIHFLEDPDGQMRIEEVASPALSGRFEAIEQGSFNRGYSESRFWLRLSIDPVRQEGETLERILLVHYPLLDYLALYRQGIDGTFVKSETGDQFPYYQREIRHGAFAFKVALQRGTTTTLYIALKTRSSVQAPVTLWHPDAFQQHQRVIDHLYGTFFGALIIMFCYNLCLFIVVRTVDYLYYILSLASSALLQAALLGLGFEYLWPQNPAVNEHIVPFAMFLMTVFVLLFTRRILELKKVMPKANKVLSAYILLSVAGTLVSLYLPHGDIVKLAIVHAGSGAMIAFSLGIKRALDGSAAAKLYVAGWGAFLIGTVLLQLVALGVLRPTPLTTNGQLIGIAIEVTLFSFALAQRINTLRMEKNALQKQTQEALLATNQALEENLQLKNEFLATISHELRTPMNGIIGSLDNIDEAESEAIRSQYQQTARKSAHEMMTLVEGILVYAEIQSGELKLERKGFCVADVCKELEHRFGSNARNKGLAFHVETAPGVPADLIGDKRQFVQVLSCLLDNAIKFTRAGRVSLLLDRVAGDDPSRVSLACKIMDTGPGIPEEKRKAMFASFRQMDGSFQRRHGGLGIGLAIARAIAQRMGGDLEYAPHPSGGSCFVFQVTFELGEVPLAAPPSEAPIGAQTGVAAGGPLQDWRILVVEDNEVNQMVLKGKLKKLGANVVLAGDGQVATEILEHQNFDVILMDCQMPVMDGFEATKKIRCMPTPCCNIPIIAVTANAMSNDRQRCLQAGMDDYIAKPVDMNLLLESLRRVTSLAPSG